MPIDALFSKDRDLIKLDELFVLVCAAVLLKLVASATLFAVLEELIVELKPVPLLPVALLVLFVVVLLFV